MAAILLCSGHIPTTFFFVTVCVVSLSVCKLPARINTINAPLVSVSLFRLQQPPLLSEHVCVGLREPLMNAAIQTTLMFFQYTCTSFLFYKAIPINENNNFIHKIEPFARSFVKIPWWIIRICVTDTRPYFSGHFIKWAVSSMGR